MIHRRNLRQLLVVWGTALLFLLGLYRLQVRIPALDQILLPVYWVVFGTAVFFSGRWVRGRGHGNRRGGDRRHDDRRGDPPAGAGT